jgi:2-methylcitrate dehydratase PrpD
VSGSGIGVQLAALCEWTVAQRWDDIPDRVRKRARWVLADDMAAMIAAAPEPEVEAYRRMIEGRGAKAEATIIGPGLLRTDRWQAASANALAASWCELDEGFRTVTCHAGLYVVPATLAEVEAASLRLADALRAVALAYECVTRIACAFRFSTPTIHAHALWSAIGAAVATAVARGDDAATLKGAITAAATLTSVGPRPHLVEGVLARNVWAAAGAVAGMQCADWSACGITGADSSPAAVFRDILHAREDADALTAGLGERWSIESGFHKLYACCQHGHSAVEGLLDLLARERVDPQRIAAIDAWTYPLALSLANAEPTTSLGAKFSMPHMIAAPLAYGSAPAEAFSQRALAHAGVARLRHLVRLHPYEGELVPPFDRPSRIVLTMDDGETLTAACRSARGGPDRPLADDVLLEKIGALAAPVLPGLPALVTQRDGADEQKPWRDVLARLAAR